MGYTEEKKEQAKEAKRQAEETRVAEVFEQFFRLNREVIKCQANEKLLRQFFGDDLSKITLQSLDDAVRHTSIGEQLAGQDETEDRKKLVHFIMTNRTMSPELAKHERARLSNAKVVSLETLVKIAENIRLKRAMSKLSVEDLKTVARSGSEKSQFHPVPAIYRNRDMLLSLASENISEFRRLVHRCGNEQIDKILATKD